jgi:hypothetical protein
MKTAQWNGSHGERVFMYMGVLYVHGNDGEVWYMADPSVVNSSDISYMLGNRPEQAPMKITSETISDLGKRENSIEMLEGLSPQE